MISLYSGTPGSGKSLHIAQVISDRSRFHRLTIGNFEIRTDLLPDPDSYIWVENEDLTFDFLVKFSVDYFKSHKYKEGSILVIIDEAQLIFNSREWNRSDRFGWIKFFTQHRKLGYNIIMVSQYDKMLDKQIRCLFEYEYIHRKISNFGWKGKLVSMWTGNRLFLAVKFWYPLKTKVGQESFLYKKKYGELYDTNFLFDSFSTVSDSDDNEEPDDEGLVFVDL